ncbi:MAG: polyphosphate kinase 1 [Oscillospiraceae bacterium]|nr:polyphosphate kinase 1 [Oscillospiraceae bacterium]
MPAKEKAAVTQEPTKKEENLYINRELSWLSFNERVLLEAADTTVPLLERLKFLMIYQSNLEEFYRVRIGILTHRAILTPDKRDPVSGMMAAETIQEVLRITREQLSLMESVWKAVRSELKRNGVEVLNFNKINKVDELMSKKLFGDIKNLLFPKIIDPNQALPFFWGEESYVVAFLGRNTIQKLAIIPMHRVPPYLSFEIDGVQKIVLTDQLIRRFLPLLLKKENILQSAVVKVTRNADVFLSELAGKEDLREKTSNMLSKRKRETPVRAKIYGKLTDPARALLIKKLHVPEQRVFQATVPFDLSFRSCIGSHEHFRYEERKPAREIGLKKGEYFRYIEKHDLLMSFPFQSMMPFVDLIYEAADDPEVLSIKITLYRMSASSKIAAALAYAADKGKDVLCLLELRARFDEQNNIDYSEMLEDAGCRIIYGLPEHKVHSKLCLITRQHGGNIETITQVGTGNYNEITGEQYTDLSLITADPEAGKDAEATFQALLRGELPPEAHTLWVAPLSFKSRVLEYLDREIAKGARGRVAIKCNAMNNPEIMEKLIECSQAGVQVELFIRGICCLRPGIPGKTENITVKSVVGRWLEHSRVYCFGEGEDEKLFIGSGDLLNRNLERRVEAFVEIRTPETREQIHEILNALREDREKSRTMQPDGSYIREPDGAGTSSQERLYQYFSKRRVSLDEEKPEPAASAAGSIPVKPVLRQRTKEADPPQKPVSAWDKIKRLFG